jgi:pheromone shutdown protein TraB
MSSTLLRIAKEHNSVVAVVGKGHLQGIKRHWEQHIEVCLEHIFSYVLVRNTEFQTF